MRIGRSAGTLAMIGFFALCDMGRAQIVINELHYNPPGSDSVVLLEFIELYNTSGSVVDVSGWQLDFGIEPYVFPAGSSIAAGAYAVVAENIVNLENATGYTAEFEFGGIAAGLSNGGEEVLLRDGAAGASNTIDTVVYDDDPPWPIAWCDGGGNAGLPCDTDLDCPDGFCVGPDGGGRSLELIDWALDNNRSNSWAASLVVNGTPGSQNSVYSVAPTVAGEAPERLSSVDVLDTVSVTFSTSVTGVTAADLTVGGSPATSVSGSGAGPYVFDGFAAPSPGSVPIVLASGAIEAGGTPFGGDSWTISAGLVIVINEIHYHPPDPYGLAEFIELFNAGSASADMSGWTVSDGVGVTFAAGTTLPPGGYLVIARDSVLLEAQTGYAGAIQWTVGALANEGERLALSDANGNQLDVLSYADRGSWPVAADGTGPSLELINPALANQYGPTWAASLGTHGTPGAQNSTYQATLAPIMVDVRHDPPIPLPTQDVTVTVTVIDDAPSPTVTLYYRQDQDPTIAYSSTAMFDDGLHGDGAAGDTVYGATISPGLANGERLDFTLRADDGVDTSAAPPGHDTLVAGEFPQQTFLCEFSDDATPGDFPTYRLITTRHNATLQEADHGPPEVRPPNEYDATFVQCDQSGDCEVYYNVVERYRGASTLYLHPHGYRVNFPGDKSLSSEMGFAINNLDLMAQAVDRQSLGYQFFREAFGGTIPTSRTQFVRLTTSPQSHGGAQGVVYLNVERVDGDFLRSQGGNILPPRLPNQCSVTGAPCDADADCDAGETCVEIAGGSLYRGRDNANLEYLGADPAPYRPYWASEEWHGYEKETNSEEDIWQDLIDLCFAIDADTTPDEAFETALGGVIDVDEWARWFAVHMLLTNAEGGLYKDSGDDYFVYFEPTDSPNGYNAKLVPWDMDGVLGGGWYNPNFNTNQQTIWRTGCTECRLPSVSAVDNPKRFVRSNAFGGRFVGAICQLLNDEFSQANMDAMIDALPDAALIVSSPSYPTPDDRRNYFKTWVANRRAYVYSEVVSQLTLENVPASPYNDPDPVIVVSGSVDQCGTHDVLINGQPVDSFSIFRDPCHANCEDPPGTRHCYDLNTTPPCTVGPGASWSHTLTLQYGNNPIVVQCLDSDGVEIDRVEDSVLYEWCVNDGECDDNDACNGQETCQVGTCVAGTPLDCDDANVCTDDACDPALGCQHVNNTAPCDDGQFCTLADACSDGVCVGSGATCPDSCQQCDESAGECLWCIFDLDGNGWIAPGDFSFFAGCYGSCYVPGQPCMTANFDASPDGCVGPGDFAGFAGCYGDACASCANCFP